jgi:succinate dehydrogenase/fumarate reductase flavoprotein subunit
VPDFVDIRLQRHVSVVAAAACRRQQPSRWQGNRIYDLLRRPNVVTVTTAPSATIPAGLRVNDITVDLLVVGSGTGMAAALAAHDRGLNVLIVEKSSFVGGSTARSGGALWLPASPILEERRAGDTTAHARRYLESVVGNSAPAERSDSFLQSVSATVELLQRSTPMRFMWAREYSDYHPEQPGGSALGRTCECKPFNTSILGEYRTRLRPGIMEAKMPMPTTGADYRWMNLVARVPRKGIPTIAKRLSQGVGGLLIGKRYVAGGQALAAGLFAGVLAAGIPVWLDTALVELTAEGDEVTGAIVEHDGRRITVTARHGVVLAAGGFDHHMDMRRKFQSESLGEHASLGADTNTGDAIRIAQDVGAAIDLMDQAWWFPAVAPLPGAAPLVMLAERSLPGSLIVDQTGNRFANESTDYMSFGQCLLERERSGNPVETMWIVFDQQYRNSYVFAAELFPRMAIPQTWYDAGIAHRSESLADLAVKMNVPQAQFLTTMSRFNEMSRAGEDSDYGRGRSAYDRYYGDPTVSPNPNLRALDCGPFYAVKMVLSDLGTCGGLRADGRARVLREDGSAIEGLYAIGNTAANAFGSTYPGAGATIAQGLVYGYLAAHDAAARD